MNKRARSTSPDEDFQLNQKFIHPNNFDKIFLYLNKRLMANKQTIIYIYYFCFTFSMHILLDSAHFFSFIYIYIYIYLVLFDIFLWHLSKLR